MPPLWVLRVRVRISCVRRDAVLEAYEGVVRAAAEEVGEAAELLHSGARPAFASRRSSGAFRTHRREHTSQLNILLKKITHTPIYFP